MRKLKFYLSFICFFLPFISKAQEIVVTSMLSSPMDMTANLSENLHKDKKGVNGGLVKVLITANNVTFKGDGILETKQFQTSEYWVFMANKANKLTVQVEGCAPHTIDFREYDCVVSSLTTYVLTLKIQNSGNTSGELLVNYLPLDADVYLDNQKLGTSPNVFSQLVVGQHDVSIRKSGYKTQTIEVTLQPNEQQSIEGKLTEATPMTFTVNGVSFNMIPVEGGTFMMGGTEEQGEDVVKDRELPVHQVTLSDFVIGETPVTEALWNAVMGTGSNDRDNGKYDEYPKADVRWNDCQDFIKKLNEMTGKTFRLPTEAEWEFAARGGIWSKGTKYAGSNDPDEVGWSESNTSKKKPVKQKKPNELGLYDMSGTMGEFCQDKFAKYGKSPKTNPVGTSTKSDRVIRGGSWYHYNVRGRVSNRQYLPQDKLNDTTGLRLAM